MSKDTIYRQAAIDEIDEWIKAFLENGHKESAADACLIQDGIMQLQSAQPDNDRLERCRFEYLNACKTVTFPTPDARKNDIYDAYAVIKALHPIFGDVEF